MVDAQGTLLAGFARYISLIQASAITGLKGDNKGVQRLHKSFNPKYIEWRGGRGGITFFVITPERYTLGFPFH